jgi:F0F1-type ATP synthase membrane subunit b/b'
VEAKNTLSALIYDVTQNVKPGQENAVEIIKSAIDNAFKGYEQVTQSTREAMRRVEEQVARASAQVATAQTQAGGGKGQAPKS